jgi:hypothetical protein
MAVDDVFRFDPRLGAVSELPADVDAEVDRLFDYQPWDDSQIARGKAVREALAAAFKTLLVSVPPCPTRTIALRHVIDARLLANAAITFKGQY